VRAPAAPARGWTTRGLLLARQSATGYTVVEAGDMDAAVALLEHCPIATSVRIYPDADERVGEAATVGGWTAVRPGLRIGMPRGH